MIRHPKASRTASIDAGGRHPATALTLIALVALLALVFVSSASALSQRPFKETFGSAAQPTIPWPELITVEKDSGDVLVGDYIAKTISRYHADGTPAPFARLGTNVIDGKMANGKPCSEEPASCDQTPENGLEIKSAFNTQIAVDESNGPAAGDIYVTADRFQVSAQIDIFAADGSYLGKLSGPNTEEDFESVAGVAVDQTGAVYVAANDYIRKFAPTGNPVVNTDGVLTINAPPGNAVRGLAVGAGPSAGSIFALGGDTQSAVPRAYEFDLNTGEHKYTFAEGRAGVGGIAVDPATGTVLMKANGSEEIAEYEAPGGSEPVRVARALPVRSIGFGVNASSELIVAEGPIIGAVGVYGTPAITPTVTVQPASEVIGTKAVLSGTVNPAGLPVTDCFFEFGESGFEDEIPCEGPIPTDSSPHPVHATLSGLEPNGHTYQFRLVALNANGREESQTQTFTTADTVVVEPATALSAGGATLNGTVRSEGDQFTACFFEYGLTTSSSFENTVPCSPGASGISADFSPHAVKAAITGLQSGLTYRYRLVATNSSGTIETDELTFSTYGLPRIPEVRASFADQNSMTLEAKINPSGFGTSYRFEWGPTAAYGNLAPAEFEPFIGSGTDPVLVKVRLSGLTSGSTYHYRVVASSVRGVVQSPDHVAETLNSCGLPEGRCVELVSRRDAGPVAIPGEFFGSAELHYQAAVGGDAVTYPVESGYPEATKGAEVLYRSTRSSDGWHSTQLSVPLLAANEHNDVGSEAGEVRLLSDDLSCGFAESNQALTADPSARLVIENGGTNIYRINPDGSYTAVTKLAPENAAEASGGLNYSIYRASQDCGKVVFSSHLRYPGIPGKGTSRLYEWDGGTLRNLGVVPGPSGEVVVEAVAGGSATIVGNQENVVSEDGSRVFFGAERKTSPNPAEIGKNAVFVRENGTVTRDLSLSQTATPADNATYEWASADGSRVFFTANAGLTADSNSEGTDLYEYDLETEELTDRSVTPAEGGAQVAGFIAAAEDGSSVYFASRNQLIPGYGQSRAQNLKADRYSIYREADGEVTYVGAFSGDDIRLTVIASSEAWTSQASPDGRYLLFQSALDLTDYESGGSLEAYLYDAQAQSLTCVSCRQDGLPSLAPDGSEKDIFQYRVLPRGGGAGNHTHPPQFLVVRNGKPRVFFSSPDVLANDAVAGQNNIYEWSHDQVFRLAGAPEGAQEHPFAGNYSTFAGASEEGSDVYFSTSETLSWEDGDQRISVYDARIGGGFPEPPAPPAPCNATAEDSCQGPAQGAPVVPGAASATFDGPGNLSTRAHRKKHHRKHKKKQHKKKQHKKSKNGKGKQARHANGNGRTGK